MTILLGKSLTCIKVVGDLRTCDVECYEGCMIKKVEGVMSPWANLLLGECATENEFGKKMSFKELRPNMGLIV